MSKFRDWLRGTKAPESVTFEEWDEWREIAKKKKIRYWLAEDCLDFLQDFVCWPFNKINDIRYYIYNRCISKTHSLTSLLKKGQYHELDTRILHCLFDELIYFVEGELAWLHLIVNEDKNKEFKRLKYKWFDIFKGYKNPAAGIDRLKWEQTLKFDDDWMDKNNPEYGQRTPQALGADEILELYKWWKEERPKRPDPHDASGWSEYCDRKKNIFAINKDDSKAKEILETLSKMEQDFEDEDTNMMIRLIKVRHRLWT
jgi:hypothetical protein